MCLNIVKKLEAEGLAQEFCKSHFLFQKRTFICFVSKCKENIVVHFISRILFQSNPNVLCPTSRPPAPAGPRAARPSLGAATSVSDQVRIQEGKNLVSVRVTVALALVLGV